jgi:hypothetical protein
MAKRLRDSVKDESGFQSFEWSYLLLVFLFLVSVLLPDIILIGKHQTGINSVATYGVQQAAKQGALTEVIVQEMEAQLLSKGIQNYAIYGTSEMQNFGDPVEVQVFAAYAPNIVRFISGLANQGDIRVIRLNSHKIEGSEVYLR